MSFIEPCFLQPQFDGRWPFDPEVGYVPDVDYVSHPDDEGHNRDDVGSDGEPLHQGEGAAAAARRSDGEPNWSALNPFQPFSVLFPDHDSDDSSTAESAWESEWVSETSEVGQGAALEAEA
jgi:hypothetical protein